MLTVSLTDAEKERFKCHASIYGLGLTDYVRRLDSRSDLCEFSDSDYSFILSCCVALGYRNAADFLYDYFIANRPRDAPDR